VFQEASASVGALIPSATVGQQSRLLPERYDAFRPSLDRLFICSPRNMVITGKGDQLFDVGITVVPLLDHIRQIELGNALV
jgi:hypothetical protein